MMVFEQDKKTLKIVAAEPEEEHKLLLIYCISVRKIKEKAI